MLVDGTGMKFARLAETLAPQKNGVQKKRRAGNSYSQFAGSSCRRRSASALPLRAAASSRIFAWVQFCETPSPRRYRCARGSATFVLPASSERQNHSAAVAGSGRTPAPVRYFCARRYSACAMALCCAAADNELACADWLLPALCEGSACIGRTVPCAVCAACVRSEFEFAAALWPAPPVGNSADCFAPELETPGELDAVFVFNGGTLVERVCSGGFATGGLAGSVLPPDDAAKLLETGEPFAGLADRGMLDWPARLLPMRWMTEPIFCRCMLV